MKKKGKKKKKKNRLELDNLSHLFQLQAYHNISVAYNLKHFLYVDLKNHQCFEFCLDTPFQEWEDFQERETGLHYTELTVERGREGVRKISWTMGCLKQR